MNLQAFVLDGTAAPAAVVNASNTGIADAAATVDGGTGDYTQPLVPQVAADETLRIINARGTTALAIRPVQTDGPSELAVTVFTAVPAAADAVLDVGLYLLSGDKLIDNGVDVLGGALIDASAGAFIANSGIFSAILDNGVGDFTLTLAEELAVEDANIEIGPAAPPGAANVGFAAAIEYLAGNTQIRVRLHDFPVAAAGDTDFAIVVKRVAP